MPSETDVLNGALSLIGQKPIVSIDDGSTAANLCKIFYPTLRDATLRAHHWNFATKRGELAQDAIPPVFEFAFSYTLPLDLLKIREYNGANPDTSTISLFEASQVSRYVIEGRKLLTNDGAVKIVYTMQVIDVNQWDGMFYQAIMYLLASQLAGPILHDVKLMAGLLEMGRNVWLSDAMAVDGQEGSIMPFISDALTRVRRG